MLQRARRRLLAFAAAVLTAPLLAAGAASAASSAPAPSAAAHSAAAEEPGARAAATGGKVIGYFAQWGVHQRGYHVKNIETSGSASKLTHINYAFGNVVDGKCAVGDAEADYGKFYDAGASVDGQADSWDPGALRGSFNQLRKLKKKHPHLKVLWSFGGWTWSGGFGQAARNPAAFAESCHRLVEDPRWADVFDGIDIDWEYPNACGLSCDNSGPGAFRDLMRELRSRFGSDSLVTAAITADASSGGKIEKADYAGAARFVDWYLPMTYDFFGAWAATGPTAPHSPLRSYPGIPQQGFDSDSAIRKLKGLGIPSDKLLLGIGFYGRGWTGVTQKEPGGTATGAAPGTYEQGIEDYKVLKSRCPADGIVAGTAYGHCGGQWWSYDTPATIAGKMAYARNQQLGGSFFWELSGDTQNGELITAIHSGLAGGGDTGGTTTGGSTSGGSTTGGSSSGGSSSGGGTSGGGTSGGDTGGGSGGTSGSTTGGGGECTAPAWNSGDVYLGGQNVSWKQHTWKAKWWTRGEEPGTTGEWGVWQDLGAC